MLTHLLTNQFLTEEKDVTDSRLQRENGTLARACGTKNNHVC